ncbi:MAG: dTDP-4-dehydrorhamnose reductase [Saprospiraceae bacterium]|nr:dTDP-4-dehydrorhamnose reductase [Saprospiraceae bacterium]
MKVLVTGSNGQLGLAIKSLSENYDHQLDFTDVDSLDITNRVKVDEYFLKLKPDIVINCAAYTNVEKAEIEQDLAKLINCDAVGILADIALKYSVKIIHISTDFVFDGNRNVPYTEDDLPAPVNIYAKTKYEGELKLIKSQADGIILRTSWLFSEYGHNFVKTIYNLAQKKSELRVVNDQFGSPTYAVDLAETILKIIGENSWSKGKEIYHFCNSGVASWYDSAQEIVNICSFECKIIPVSTEEYGAGVIRPKYSVLDTSKIRGEFSLKVRPWREALGECLKRLSDGARERRHEGAR